MMMMLLCGVTIEFRKCYHLALRPRLQDRQNINKGFHFVKFRTTDIFRIKDVFGSWNLSNAFAAQSENIEVRLSNSLNKQETASSRFHCPKISIRACNASSNLSPCSSPPLLFSLRTSRLDYVPRNSHTAA
jgi:hypothetical protein